MKTTVSYMPAFDSARNTLIEVFDLYEQTQPGPARNELTRIMDDLINMKTRIIDAGITRKLEILECDE